jgi:hypothetical protein
MVLLRDDRHQDGHQIDNQPYRHVLTVGRGKIAIKLIQFLARDVKAARRSHHRRHEER